MTAPWLAPLMTSTPMTSTPMTSRHDGTPSSGPPTGLLSASTSQASLEKERERQKREERDREREKERQRERERDREREREKERERERSERQERDRKREEERERERRRHASRSPLHHHSRAHSSASNSGGPSGKAPDPSKSVASSMAGFPSLSSSSYTAGMMSSAAMFADRSRLGLGPLPPNPYGQHFDPFRDGLLRGMDPRESEFLSRFGPNALGMPGAHAALYGPGASPYASLPALADRYRESLARDGFPGLNGAHLNHAMSASLGLSLPGQASMPGMGGGPLYPPVSSAYPFPGLGPIPGLGGGMGSLPLLPPSMMPGASGTSGKRTPTGAQAQAPNTSMAGPSALASLQRTHMGLGLAPGLGLPPYPMPSPSPYPHLIPPPLGSRAPSGQHPGPALGQFNPLDPYGAPKSDPQAR